MKHQDVQSIVSRYELPAKIIADFAKIMADSPGLASSVFSDISSMMNGTRVVDNSDEKPDDRRPLKRLNSPKTRPKGAYEQIARHLVRTGNVPISKSDMGGLGIGGNTIFSLLYKSSFKDNFNSTKSEDRGNARLYSLKSEFFSKAKSDYGL